MTPTTSKNILDATVTILRRHGADKANVVDVAKALGMSHANIYRHFSSKKELLDAVIMRWLGEFSKPLEGIVTDSTLTPSARLVKWFHAGRNKKLRMVREDPEMFEIYYRLTTSTRQIVDDYIITIENQLCQIITDGIKSAEFASSLNAQVAAKAFFQAISKFQHPALILQEPVPDQAQADAVLGLLLAGLIHGPAQIL
jgi:AcrR family transcriptional regulator